MEQGVVPPAVGSANPEDYDEKREAILWRDAAVGDGWRRLGIDVAYFRSHLRKQKRQVGQAPELDQPWQQAGLGLGPRGSDIAGAGGGIEPTTFTDKSARSNSGPPTVPISESASSEPSTSHGAGIELPQALDPFVPPSRAQAAECVERARRAVEAIKVSLAESSSVPGGGKASHGAAGKPKVDTSSSGQAPPDTQ